MTRIFRFLRIRRSRAADAAQKLSRLASAARDDAERTHRQEVRAKALQMARKHGVVKAVEVLSR